MSKTCAFNSEKSEVELPRNVERRSVSGAAQTTIAGSILEVRGLEFVQPRSWARCTICGVDDDRTTASRRYNGFSLLTSVVDAGVRLCGATVMSATKLADQSGYRRSRPMVNDRWRLVLYDELPAT